MCKCMEEMADKLKEKLGCESVMPQIDLLSGRAYIDFTITETGKKKQKKVPVLLSRCPICGEDYKEVTE